MFVRQLIVVGCLLLAVEFLEAKNIFRHKKTSLREARQFVCPEGSYKCPSSNRCINEFYLCDGDKDCLDGSDEQNCSSDKPWVCRSTDAPCPTAHLCIHKHYFCDGQNDCGDNSDEDETFCRTRRCRRDQVRCNNGQCLNKERFCGSILTCQDGSLSTNSELCPKNNKNQH